MTELEKHIFPNHTENIQFICGECECRGHKEISLILIGLSKTIRGDEKRERNAPMFILGNSFDYVLR